MVANQRPKTKIFKKSRTIAPIHTGGPVAISSDGSNIVTCVSEEAVFTDLLNGKLLCRFSGDTQTITSLCLTPDASHLIMFTAAPSLRIFKIPPVLSGQYVHPFRVTARAHDAPVHVCTVDPSSTYLASGSADGIVKVSEISTGHVTHVFKGHGGVVSALKFNFPRDPSAVQHHRVAQLITASVDTKIRIFDLLATSRNEQGALHPNAVLEGHVSVPRGLDITPDGKCLVSGGRDGVVLIWDMSSTLRGIISQGKGKAKTQLGNPILVKTIPVMERVEAVGLIQCDPNTSLVGLNQHLFTAGERGIIKIWDWKEGVLLRSLGAGLEPEQEEQRQILDAMYLPSVDTILSVHADQNIFFHSAKSGSLTRQVIGFNDEIVDAVFLSSPTGPSTSDCNTSDTHVALATNSSLIRVYSASSLDAHLLSGHSDVVLSLDRSAGGHLLASGSKDNSARIWAPSNSSADRVQWGCIAVCEGHAGSVGATVLSRIQSDNDARPQFMLTGSQDRTIKMWDLRDVSLIWNDDGKLLKCRSLVTHKAHEKDINSLDLAPTDQLLASGSQDRTANVYEISYRSACGGRSSHGEIRLLGTCKGHKRGVWNVKFGKTERVLATGSGDKTVKLWNLDDFTCVKTFEGHANSVLRVDFINNGTQLVSSGSDGLVKLWNTRDEECTATLDNHEDKVWALAISTDERMIVSGAADSVVTFWEDYTKEHELEREAKRAEVVLREQDFMNYLALHDYRKAIELALAMQQPGRLFSLFKDIKSTATQSPPTTNTSVTGHPAVDEVLRSLSNPDLALLLRYVRDWNSNARTSGVAQSVLYAIVKLRHVEDVIAAFGDELSQAVSSADDLPKQAGGRTALKELVDGLIPYTQRHLSRLERLIQESFVLDYILNEMDGDIFEGEDHAMVDD